MIYTIDRTTNQVVMISEAPNTYDNPDFFDIETDDEYSEWLGTRTGEEELVYDEETETIIDAAE
jgi:hypothetical protein